MVLWGGDEDRGRDEEYALEAALFPWLDMDCDPEECEELGWDEDGEEWD